MKIVREITCLALLLGISFGNDDDGTAGTTLPPYANATDNVSTTTIAPLVMVSTTQTQLTTTLTPSTSTTENVQSSVSSKPALVNVSSTKPDVTFSSGFRPVVPYWPPMSGYYYYSPPISPSVCGRQPFHMKGYQLSPPASGAWTGLVSAIQNPPNNMEVLQPPSPPALPTEKADPLYTYARFDFTGNGNDASWTAGSHPRARRALFGWRVLSTRKPSH